MTPEPTREQLEAELRKLRKINQVLMDRVERNMDAQGRDAFTLFQTAITLEGRVSERTDELTSLTQRLMHEISQRRETEKALLVAKAEAEQANLGKTHFLAAASHDLHQPLAAARLFLGALAAEVDRGRPLELVRRVESALETVSDLIEDVMDISRLDTGGWAVTPSTFPAGPLLMQLGDEFAPQAAACDLALSVVPSGVHLHTDRTLLQRALSNLISNAIRYTPTGRVLIGCRRRRDRLAIEVWDTGVGIPDSVLPLIFEEFRQLGPPPRVNDKGFGLGLAIVDRIVRLLDLKIEVRSQVGKGSRFALLVPLGDPADAHPEPEPARGPVFGKPWAGLLAACIDTDPAASDALATLLGSWGCRTISAEGTDAALQVLGARTPDLIVADYRLDQTERGTDAVATIRQHHGRAIPAIIVCRDRTPALRGEVEALGCGFLAKPIQPAKLRAMISQVLDQEPVG